MEDFIRDATEAGFTEKQARFLMRIGQYRMKVEVKKEMAKDNFLPDWMPLEQWADFVLMRANMKKPLTDLAKKIVITKIDSLRGKIGNSPKELLEAAIEKNWLTVYENKGENGNGRQTTAFGRDTRSTRDREVEAEMEAIRREHSALKQKPDGKSNSHPA